MKHLKAWKKIAACLLLFAMMLSVVACEGLPSQSNSKNNKEQSSSKKKEKDSSNSGETKTESTVKEENNTEEEEEEQLNWDDPDYEEKLAKQNINKLEKAYQKILGRPDFSFNGLVDGVMPGSILNENEVGAALVSEKADELETLLKTYIPDDYCAPISAFDVNYVKETYRCIMPEFTTSGIKEWYRYGNTFSVMNMLGMVTLSVKMEDIRSSDPATDAYIEMGVPYSAAKTLALFDEIEPGIYSTDGSKIYICENGDVVRDNQSGARLYAATHDFKLYDLSTGHFFYDYDSATHYDLNDYSKNKTDFYTVKAEYFASMVNTFSAYETLSKKKYANAFAVFEVLRPGCEVFDWGYISETYSNGKGYEYQSCAFMQHNWITEFPPPPLHPSRDIQYITGKYEDMIECTTMSRGNNSYFEWDTQTCYTVNERIIEFDTSLCDDKTPDELIELLISKGVSPLPEERYMFTGDIWLGEVYVYTEYIDGQAFQKYDSFSLTWDLDNEDPAEDRLTLSINYWFHTHYV